MKKTQLMGILNCTPDSFYEGSRTPTLEAALATAYAFIEEGADWIDIGGESTRPFAKPVPVEEELKRVLPLFKELKGKIPLSIDTFKPEVAKGALEAGASLLNDITGFSNPLMRQLAKEFRPLICVMHMQGTPQTMQEAPHYPQGLIPTLEEWFKKRIDTLLQEGILPEQLILDPGIGFGKTVEQNLLILKELPKLQQLGFPVLLGLSRKSFLQKILKKTAREVLSTTIALNTMSILQKVSFIRVHDVREHRDVIDILQLFE